MTTDRPELFALTDDELLDMLNESIEAMSNVIQAHGHERGPFLGAYRRAHQEYKAAREVLNIRWLPHSSKPAR